MQIFNYKIYVDSCYHAVHKFRKSFFKKVIIPGALNHFQPMFDLCRNQVAGFYYQMFYYKHLWKSDILSKDAGLYP